MPSAEFLGFVAGAFTTCAFVPQVIRVYQIKSAHDISLPFSIALVMGGICWLIYGILFRLYPVILWNALSVVLTMGLLIAKLKYGR